MNNEFNNNDNDNEIVDSIPQGTKKLGDDSPTEQQNNRNQYNTFNNSKTKIIIENGPACMASKIAFMFALGSVIFCCFPTWSIIFALLGAGIGLFCIASGYNGRIVSAFAIGISIFGAVLAMLSNILYVIWNSFVRLLF